MTHHTVIVGLMGSGKSEVGRLLADRLGQTFVDSDTQLRLTTGRTAAELARDRGSDELHALERSALELAIDRPDRTVVAAAASVVDSPDLAELLTGHRVIWLTADVETLADRVADPGHRPFLDEDAATTLREQARRRNAGYEDLADLVVDTTRLSPVEVVERILADAHLEWRVDDPRSGRRCRIPTFDRVWTESVEGIRVT